MLNVSQICLSACYKDTNQQGCHELDELCICFGLSLKLFCVRLNDIESKENIMTSTFNCPFAIGQKNGFPTIL